MLPSSSEPAHGVSIKGGSDLKSMDVRGHWNVLEGPFKVMRVCIGWNLVCWALVSTKLTYVFSTPSTSLFILLRLVSLYAA